MLGSALVTLALSIALVLSPLLCWHHGPHCAGVAALVMLVLLTLLHWCCHCLQRGLQCRLRLSTCQLNKGKDACKSTAQCKHNKSKEACVTRGIMPAHQGKLRQHDKGDNISATAQTRQAYGGNNISAMTVMTPMQCGGKEVSAIRTTMLVQQGQQHPCNVGNGASAMRATTPS